MIRDKYLDINRITGDTNILKIFEIVRNHGGVVRFVGGAVRDALVEANASNLDLSTDLTPEELAEACEEAGIRTVPIGLKIDTLGVVVDGTLLEISSLKKQKEKDNGHIEFEFTDDWKADASQRDLTINAVYADDKGNVFDYYDGISDLEKGIVRFIDDGDKQIKSDYIRILRFFRFYSLFGKTEIDKKSLKACKENINGLKNLPIERVREELFKILLTPKAPAVLKIMFENNILSNWLEDSPYLQELKNLIEIHQKYTFSEEAVFRLFVLYHPDKALAENMAMRLKLTKKQKDKLVTLATEFPKVGDLSIEQNRLKTIYYFGKVFCSNCLLLKTISQENPQYQNNFVDLYESIKSAEVPLLPISGKDLVLNGVSGNSKIGAEMERLETLWVESGFKLTKEELLAKI